MCGISIRPSKYGIKSVISYRGPDASSCKTIDDYVFIFHRLAVHDVSEHGMQPFENDHWLLVCNGSVFNFRDLKAKYASYPYISDSDCETLIPLLENNSLYDACNLIDGEFAFVAFDKTKRCFIAARDPIVC